MQLQVPENVYLQPWLPQNDILGQSNTVLFITHCGNNGLYEALYHGVPVLGIPLFSEQGKMVCFDVNCGVLKVAFSVREKHEMYVTSNC
jgi:UDP:flavonoid glycosyltransferase YjiC (YdhE family)